MKTILCLLGFCGLVAPLSAAEVTTNGIGGGAWSEPTTWKGKALPGAEDDVVIRKGDVVVFDRNDTATVTCQKLLIDPRGALRFKTGMGKVVCVVAGEIETYGPISLDGSKSPGDFLELRCVGDERDKRTLKLLKGGALLLRGRADLPKDARNVAITSPKLASQKEAIALTIDMGVGTTLDFQHVEAQNVSVRALEIDSTGAKQGEKFSVIGSRFTEGGRLFCQRCDTPVIRKNSFTQTDLKLREGRAIHVTECPLAEVRDNTIHGGYEIGIAVGHASDDAIIGNTVALCATGIDFGFGKGHNAGRNSIRDCDRAISIAYTAMATLEENSIENAKVVLRTVHATVQCTSLHAAKLPADATGILYDNDGTRSGGSIVLINCNLRPEQVKITMPPNPKDNPSPPVTAMDYLVVQAKGIADDAELEVRTVGIKADADENVRNSPAPMMKGLSPLPMPAGAPLTVSPLVVRSWQIGYDGKIQPAPKYELRILAPAEKPGAERKVLRSGTACPAPNWFRAKVDDPTPTPEVTLR